MSAIFSRDITRVALVWPRSLVSEHGEDGRLARTEDLVVFIGEHAGQEGLLPQ
jgi:hypothetical protein